MIISADLAFDNVTKWEFKENVLRGRCQDTDVSVNLAFGYQSKFRQFLTRFSTSDWFLAMLKISTEHGS